MPEKDKNYVSAVVYVGSEKDEAAPFLKELCAALGQKFANYELVLVEDASRDGTEGEIKAFLEQMEEPPAVSMIHMSLKQGLELAMNAGLDMAIGDFVYEFDTMKMPYPKEMILKAYEESLLGSDIVTVSPKRSSGPMSSAFYALFNRHSSSKYPIHTDAFRLLSRRAINRVHAISESLPYRKAAYAASGLKLSTLNYSGSAPKSENLRFSRAVDSLALYTDVAAKFSIAIAVAMLGLMLGALAYTLVVTFGLATSPVPGWTTTMLMLTGGFFAVFLLLAFILKYLTLLLGLVFQKQRYLVESVEKIK